MKNILTLCLVVVSMISGFTQNEHKISLGLEKLEGSFLFSVTEIIDGRKDKSNVGWVQKGVANARRTAVMSRGVDREFKELLLRSNVTSATGPKTIIRIEYLAISEQTRASSETAKAEVVLDLFYIENDSAWFIARQHHSKESRGMDVTAKHPRNIAFAINEIFKVFNSKAIAPDSSRQPIPISGIESFRFEERESLSSSPVFTALQYPEGLYANFDEFYSNQPSITTGYEVTPGRNIKVRWLADDGTTKRVKSNVYALSHQNNLYIFFNNNFYPLEKRADGFFFVGPVVPDSGAMIAGGLLGGIIGGAIAASTTGERTLYQVNLSNGSLKSRGPALD